MTPVERERFDHEYLSRFAYNDRTDDGYGPDHPRIGDKGMLCHNVQAEPFTVEHEPRTGLPALHLVSGKWAGLLDVTLDPGAELILHERKPGKAEIHETDGRRFADLTPPYEGVDLVVWEHMRVYDADSMTPVGGDGLVFDFGDALMQLGYQPVGSK